MSPLQRHIEYPIKETVSSGTIEDRQEGEERIEEDEREIEDEERMEEEVEEMKDELKK